MRTIDLPPSLAGLRAHFVGAKGTGMAALAEIFAARGAILTGSDVAEVFYTDAILAAIGMDLRVGFDAGHLPEQTDLVVHSAAYGRETNPELVEALRRGLDVMSYPEALGALSRACDSSGIAGVHGKTTTTAMAGTVIGALGLDATVLAGSAVASFGGRCTLVRGNSHFVAETCEYRRHFLNFKPARILLTSVESDHQDFYPTYEDIRDAFVEYCVSLPRGGRLIYCADDGGAVDVATRALSLRPDIAAEPYGFSASGPWALSEYATHEGEAHFRLKAAPGVFILRVPGRHLVLDAAGALALVAAIVAQDGRGRAMSDSEWDSARAALSAFGGSRRRSEVLGEAGGVLFMDDYAHHPTAVAKTIEGIKEFWPSRRLVVDFMSHTYSRTAALFDDFAASLDAADCVVLHKIYASARESPLPGIDGGKLYKAVRARRPDLVEVDAAKEAAGAPEPAHPFIMYTDEPADAAGALSGLLRPGDLFLTMGAGDNWKLGAGLLAASAGLAAKNEAKSEDGEC